MWLVPFEVFPFALGHFGFNQFPVGMRRSPQHPSGFQVVLQRLLALVPTVPAVGSVRDSDRPGLNPALEGPLATVFVPLNYRVEVVGTQPLRSEVREVTTGLWVVRVAGVRSWVLALSLPLAPLVLPELVAGSLAGVLVRSLSDFSFSLFLNSLWTAAAVLPHLFCRVRVVEVQVANGLVQGPIGLLKLRAPAQLRVGAFGDTTDQVLQKKRFSAESFVRYLAATAPTRVFSLRSYLASNSPTCGSFSGLNSE